MFRARWTRASMAALVAVVALAACGEGAAPTATPAPTIAAPVATATTPAAAGTPAPQGTTAPTTIQQNAQTSYSPERAKELLAEGFYLGGMQVGFGEEPKMGGVVTVSNRGDLPGADPMLQAGISSNNVLSSIHGEGSLVKPKRDNIFVAEPHIAQSWEATDNFTVWTFKLRQDVKWHDGTGLVAEDLKFWIDLANFPPKGRRTAYVGTFGPLKEVQIVDNYTLRLVMNSPSPHLLDDLSNNAAAPTHPRHLLKPLLDGGNVMVSMQEANWVSVGPFKFDNYAKGSSFRAVKFDQYFEKDEKGRRLPYLDGIYYPFIPDRTVAVSALRAGRIDGTSRGTGHHLQPDQVESIKKSLGNKAWFMRLSYLSWGAGLQATKPPFDDIRVRRAIVLYTDRQEGIKLVYGGYALEGTFMVPGSMWSDPSFVTWAGFNPKTKAQDQAEAKKLMQEAGMVGTPVTITCRDFYLQNCEFMESTLRGLGFVPKLDVMDLNRQTPLLQSGNFQIDMRPGGAGKAGNLLTAFVTTNPLNTHKHGDKQVDKYAELIDTTIDLKERQRLVWEADKYVTYDKAYYPHWYWEEAVVAYRTYVKGVWIPGEQVQHNNDASTWWIDPSQK